ncbi:MAG: PEP-CTERM sorting domain-containing protein [Pirellulaceae bacterium]
MKKLFFLALAVLMAPAMLSADVSVTNLDGVADWDTEAGAGPLQQTVVVGVNETITGISLDVAGITHTFIGDLSFELIAPDGTTRMFVVGQLTGGGLFGDSSDWGGDYSFADGGASLWTAAAGAAAGDPIPVGTYAASQDDGTGNEQINSFASTFGGMSTAGTWTVEFFDSFVPGDTGGMTSWTLNFQSNAVPEPTTGCVLLGLGSVLAMGMRRRK